MNIIIAECLNCDLGHKYNWQSQNSKLELYGSWDNWTTGQHCDFGAVNGTFFAYTILT